MKLGTENKKETIAAVALLGFALWYGIHQYTSAPSASAAAPAPATSDTAQTGTVTGTTAQPTTVRPRSAGRRNTQIALPSNVPGLRLDLLKASEGVTYAGTGRNIFQDEPEPLPREVKSPLSPKNTPPPGPFVPPPPPPPPPINIKFFGFANRPGQAKQVFLAAGDDTFIAKEGDIINRQYKVARINNDSVDITDILNNNTQRIMLSQ